MIFETLGSKIAVSLAVMTLTATMLGIGLWLKSEFDVKILDTYADIIKNTIDGVSTADGDLVIAKIVFNEDKNGVYLPPTINGKTYKIIFTNGSFSIEMDGYRVVRLLLSKIHYGNPLINTKMADNLKVTSGECDIAIMKMVTEGGGDECPTYIFTGA